MADVVPRPFLDIHPEATVSIDEDIRCLAQETLDSRSARNASTPISRLPVELMRAVFLLSRDGWRGDVALTISWVSRGWRELALSIPHLWHHISTTRLEWVDACITRSRCLPLDISLEIDQETNDVICVPNILEALPRIQNLNLNAIFDEADPEDDRIMAPDQWSRHAPRLECLTLCGFNLPKTFLNGDFSSLQSLYLSSCHFTFDPFPASNSLRKLTIFKPDIPLQLSKVLDILKFSPNLEELDLGHAIDPLTLPSHPSVAVNLANLSKFDFTEAPDVTLTFVQHITLPQDVKLHVWVVWAESGDILGVPAVIEAVVDRGHLARRSYNALRITVTNWEVCLYFGDTTNIFEMFPPVYLAFETYEDNLASVMNCLDPLLPALSDIETLDLGGNAAGEDEPLSHFETFAEYRNLSDLRIARAFFLPFIRCICAPTHSIPEEAGISDANIPFPALTQLTLHEIKFTEVQFDILVVWLLGRSKISRPLSKVVFSDTRITPSQVDEIEAVVGEVVHVGEHVR